MANSENVRDKLVPLPANANAIPVLAPLSPSQDTTSDQLGTFYRPSSIPVVRHSPLPAAALSQHGAASASISQTSAGKQAYGATINLQQIPPSITNQGAIPPIQTQINNLTAVSFQGIWNATTSYSHGASVDYLGIVYVSLADNNLNNIPSSSPAAWSTAGSSYQGAYSGGTTYTPGQFVSFTDGNFYVCITSTTGNAPTPTGSTFWRLLGSSAVLLGAWSSVTAYPQGAEVTFINYIFKALQSSTNQTPPTPPATNAFWVMLGPANLALGIDGLGNVVLKNIAGPLATTSGPTITSATYAVIPEMTSTITTQGNKVMIIFTGTLTNNTTATSGFVSVFVDGVQSSPDISYSVATAGQSTPLTLTWLTAPSAASHTFDIRWKSNGVARLTAIGTSRTLQVVELG